MAIRQTAPFPMHRDPTLRPLQRLLRLGWAAEASETTTSVEECTVSSGLAVTLTGLLVWRFSGAEGHCAPPRGLRGRRGHRIGSDAPSDAQSAIEDMLLG
jgi:hypothetical protein